MFHHKGIVIISLLVTMVIVTVPSARAQIANHVVINEFELNPPGDDHALGGELVWNEFVELYNPTSTSVNIIDWKLVTTHGKTVVIPTDCECCAFTYIHVKGHREVNTFGWLENEDESIILRDAAGNEIDRTPVRSDPYDDARTWQRNPDGGTDWVFQTSTRGLPIPEFPSAPIILAVTFLTALIILRTQKKLITKEIDKF